MSPSENPSTLDVQAALVNFKESAAQAGRDRTARGNRRREEGAVGWGVLWLIGVPIPILIIAFLLRGCT